jgi:hypothetical protein
MESIMQRPSLPNLSNFSVASGTHPAGRNLARASYVTMAALVLASCAFIATGPAKAASSERATYCLSSDSQSDCGFSSLAQCEATASGGLGVCDTISALPEEHAAFGRFRAGARSGVLPRR